MSDLNDVMKVFAEGVTYTLKSNNEGQEINIDLQTNVDFSVGRSQLKLFVLDELLNALKESKDLNEGIDKFKEKVSNW